MSSVAPLKPTHFRKLEADGAKVDAVANNGLGPQPVEDGVILLQGSSLEPTVVDWLWLHWLALGKFHVLAGPPGQGKTTIAVACAATVSSGGRWPDGQRCASGNVLIWSGEDDPQDTLLPRLLAMGANVSRVYFISGTRIAGKAEPFDPARDMVQLLAEAERIGHVRLLIVDPVVSAVAGDSHKNTEVRRALQPLVDLAANLHAAVLGISHFTKGSTGRDPVERVTGSLAFGALARVVLCAVKVRTEDEGDRRILARAKSNIGPDDGGFEYRIAQTALAGFPEISASVIEWGEALAGTARELLADAEKDQTGEAATTREADDLLRDILKGADRMESRLAIDAMKAQGFTDKQIRSARERIGAKVERSGFGSAMRSFWKLPSDAQSRPVAPNKSDGQEWAGMSTNGAAGGLSDDDVEAFE